MVPLLFIEEKKQTNVQIFKRILTSSEYDQDKSSYHNLNVLFNLRVLPPVAVLKVFTKTM